MIHHNINHYIYLYSAPGKSRAMISYKKYSELQNKKDGINGSDKDRKPIDAPLKTTTGPKKGQKVIIFYSIFRNTFLFAIYFSE